MSRSEQDLALAVAPRLLDRVFGGGVEVVTGKTEGKAKITRVRCQHSRPRCAAPKQATEHMQRSTPGIPPRT